MNCLINAHSKSGDKDGAIHYFNILKEELPHIKPDIVTMTSLINAHKELRDKNGAMEYFNMMINDFNIKPDLVSMTAVLYAIVRDENKNNSTTYFKDIEDILSLMDNMKVKKNSHVYFALMEACKFKKDKERSIKWFDEIINTNVSYDGYAWGELCYIFHSIIGNEAFNHYTTKNYKVFESRIIGEKNK